MRRSNSAQDILKIVLNQSYAVIQSGIDLAVIATILDINNLNILIHVHSTLNGIDNEDAIAVEQVYKNNLVHVFVENSRYQYGFVNRC